MTDLQSLYILETKELNSWKEELFLLKEKIRKQDLQLSRIHNNLSMAEIKEVRKKLLDKP